jgi:SRSO17 transposase
LPQNWSEDRKRGHRADVSEEISFETKPEIALEHLRWACEIGVACGVVLMDGQAGGRPLLQRAVAKPSRGKSS